MKWTMLIICAMLFGCSDDSLHVYSLDRKHCITIINDKNIRYIIDGYTNEIPDTNYVKIDLGKIERSLGDHIVGLWDTDKLNWIMLMDNISVLENRLDNRRFRFKSNFPRDKQNIPTLIDFNKTKEGFFSLSFDYGRLIRNEGLIVE